MVVALLGGGGGRPTELFLLQGGAHQNWRCCRGPPPPLPRPLGADDKALLWRFRFALTPEPRALTKFLKCVDWSDASEARQAAELVAQWAPIGVADALELLSPDFVNEEVGWGGQRVHHALACTPRCCWSHAEGSCRRCAPRHATTA